VYNGLDLDKLPGELAPWRIFWDEAMRNADQKPIEEPCAH
jgi:hypothetical protein